MKKHNELVEDYMFFAILLLILIVIATLATSAEGNHKDILYPSGENKWGPVDVYCNHSPATQEKNLALTALGSSPSVNETITFTYTGTDSGVSTQTLDIYYSDTIPAGVSFRNGVSAGYKNYLNNGTSIGTSVYLQYYVSDNKWSQNTVNSLIFDSLDQSNYQINKVNGNIQFTLTDYGDLEFETNSSDSKNSLFGLKESKALDNTNSVKHNKKNVMNNYGNALDILDQTNSLLDANSDTGTSMLRCIDPSFAAVNYNCDNMKLVTGPAVTIGGPSVSLYYPKTCVGKGNGKISNKSVLAFCTSKSGPGDCCGTPYCYNGGDIKGSTVPPNYNTNKFNSDVKGPARTQTKNYYLGPPTSNNELLPTGTAIYNNGDIGTFNGAPQAQTLLFCGGTSIGNNNISDAAMTTDENKFPPNAVANVTTPYIANAPNAQVIGDQVILGFK